MECPRDVAHRIERCQKGLGAGFYPDHYILARADVAVISNSTFSHSACMLNETDGAKFYRVTHTGEAIAFDPWCSQPILHREVNGGVISKTFGALQVVYRTGGWRAVARYVALELPMEAAREAALHATLSVPSSKQGNTPTTSTTTIAPAATTTTVA